MLSRLDENGLAHYRLSIYDVLEKQGENDMNPLVGKDIRIVFTGEIHCIETGKKIKKTFGEGLSYEAWLKSPAASPSVIHPELSRIHEGIALRDFEWENEHHNKPHYVYLSRTSGVKVGVTRVVSKITRWIDQGAVEGIVLAETPYRQLAGQIEVALKNYLPDKTAWQAMLKGEQVIDDSLQEYKERMIALLPRDLEDFISDDDSITEISYPILQHPVKVKSLKLDSQPEISGTLSGIKGQYLIFSDGSVLNIRAHAGYRVKISF